MSNFEPVDPKANFSEIEQQILAFWRENDCFRQSLEMRKDAPRFEFYDGPPFATGLPHYGHILAGTIKDVIPRFQTMRGKFVPRKWGWDCHGVPVEHQIEKKLGLKNRDDIEKIGIQAFNENCRNIVMQCASDWRKTVERMGRWVDLENDYKTMDPDFMESILWVFSELYKKGMIYEGFKVVPYSPKLASPLSNFEANLNYKNITDAAVTVAFELETGEKVLAWTTTPWTLPTNLGLCVNPDLEYCQIEKDGGIFIVGENLIEKIFGKDFQILKTFSGKDLIGKSYKPLFPFFQNHENAFRIFGDDFVSDSDGTGIVHLAPTGEDDARILTANNVELFYPYTPDCHFSHENFPEDLNGLYFRKDSTVENSENNANSWVLKNLREQGKLFREESLNHSYPHCWRTECALMYRGVESFFVDVQKIKAEMIARNHDEISWIPAHIREGRFGKILENAPDWAISRSRFWGSPIPVWKSASGKMMVPSSVEEIAKNAKITGGKIFATRHGEGEHNAQGVVSCSLEGGAKLTEKGRAQAEELGKQMANEKIDAIFVSPLLRTRETAEIIQKYAPDAEFLIDDDLREIDLGKMNECHFSDWRAQFPDWKSRYFDNPHCGETSEAVGKRVENFLQKIRKDYANKNIIVVAHGEIIRHFWRFFWNRSPQEIIENIPPTGQFFEFSFSARPENDRGELDLHRPWIDRILLQKDGEDYFRTPEVLDCWFESGSMPYASTEVAKKNIAGGHFDFSPADFIAEGLDQTRGWFYTLHVLGNALFHKPAFKNVIVNGIVLAEDGQKMSKSKQNFPDPNLIFEKYGADAMRFYLMNSPAVRAEDLRFSERGVEETLRKVFLPLWNAFSFFTTYANIDEWSPQNFSGKSENKLDAWILAELRVLTEKVGTALENFKIDEAAREFPDFFDSLTNFYIRRSRRRFWKSGLDTDKNDAFATLYIVLKTVAKLLAPLAPFLPEKIWQNLRTENDPLSVHFCDFPQAENFPKNDEIRSEIEAIRTILSLGLSLRAGKKIGVRQPLSHLKIALPPAISPEKVLENALEICEELNVKNLELVSDFSDLAEKIAKPDARKIGPKFGKSVQQIIIAAKSGNFEETPEGKIRVGDFLLEPDEIAIEFIGKSGLDVASEKGIVVALDFEITKELRQEGMARELIRQFQDLRKSAGFEISDRIFAAISGADDILSEFGTMIAEEILAREISSGLDDFSLQKELEIGDQKIIIAVKKEKF